MCTVTSMVENGPSSLIKSKTYVRLKSAVLQRIYGIGIGFNRCGSLLTYLGSYTSGKNAFYYGRRQKFQDLLECAVPFNMYHISILHYCEILLNPMILELFFMNKLHSLQHDVLHIKVLSFRIKNNKICIFHLNLCLIK